MLRNSILGHPKKTLQSIAFESEIKLSKGCSVKLKKVQLGSKMFPTRRQNFPTHRKIAKSTKKFTVQLSIYLCNDSNNL